MAKNRLDFQAQLSRHSHDVSGGYSSSLTPGPIVPQYFDIVGPGDTLYYKTRLFGRLQDVVTAFLGEIDLHVDYFFVPLQMLYTPFGQIFAQTDDILSSTMKDIVKGDNFPVLATENPADDVFDFGEAFLTYGKKFVGGQDCVVKECARLFDALDANPLYFFGSGVRQHSHDSGEGIVLDDPHVNPDLTLMPNISPWAFLAYQAIYQKYFRNDDFERLNIQAYNIDQFYKSNIIYYLNDIARLRYVQRPSDYFTSVRVSPISSAVNKFGNPDPNHLAETFPLNGGNLDTLLLKVNDYLGYGSGNYASEVKNDDNSNIYPSSDGANFGVNNSSFSITSTAHGKDWFPTAANIRALFAVDKFARIYGRADKTYDDQILAHFGIKIPHDVKHDITHLKHYHVVLQSDPIYGTANIQSSQSGDIISALGQVGGQGQCLLSTLEQGAEKFTAPVHGVFMAVAYAVTKPRYFGTFSKLHMLSNRLSFPIPEFDKLGSQPLYFYEFNSHYLGVDSVQDNGLATRAGWQNRYQEFKKKYNRVSMSYVDPNQISNFLVDTPEGEIYELNNAYAPWVISRTPYPWNSLSEQTNTSLLVSAFDLFESVHALDSIMVSNYQSNFDAAWDAAPHLMFQTDPILTEFLCDCKKVSWMSETGEPEL